MDEDLSAPLTDDEASGSMLNSGDAVDVDLWVPTGSERGLLGPTVVVTAQRILTRQPTVIQVVPLTTMLRGYETEVIVVDGDNGLGRTRPRSVSTPERSPHRARVSASATSGSPRSVRSATLRPSCSTPGRSEAGR